MKKIEREVRQYIDRHDLLSPSGRYLVALSGGADSVALFRILLRLDYKVEAVHCNFKLRGEESFRDEIFCEKPMPSFIVSALRWPHANYATTILKSFVTILIWMESAWLIIKTTT